MICKLCSQCTGPQGLPHSRQLQKVPHAYTNTFTIKLACMPRYLHATTNAPALLPTRIIPSYLHISHFAINLSYFSLRTNIIHTYLLSFRPTVISAPTSQIHSHFLHLLLFLPANSNSTRAAPVHNNNINQYKHNGTRTFHTTITITCFKHKQQYVYFQHTPINIFLTLSVKFKFIHLHTPDSQHTRRTKQLHEMMQFHSLQPQSTFPATLLPSRC